MGLLNDKDLDKYLALIGTFFACELRDKQDDAFANETYRLFCSVREHIYTLMKNSEWVSVKDRLPESCGNYLVRVGKDGFNPQTKTAYWLTGKRIWKGAEAYSIITDVSHWMSLPEPPKEVSE